MAPPISIAQRLSPDILAALAAKIFIDHDPIILDRSVGHQPHLIHAVRVCQSWYPHMQRELCRRVFLPTLEHLQNFFASKLYETFSVRTLLIGTTDEEHYSKLIRRRKKENSTQAPNKALQPSIVFRPDDPVHIEAMQTLLPRLKRVWFLMIRVRNLVIDRAMAQKFYGNHLFGKDLDELWFIENSSFRIELGPVDRTPIELPRLTALGLVDVDIESQIDLGKNVRTPELLLFTYRSSKVDWKASAPLELFLQRLLAGCPKLAALIINLRRGINQCRMILRAIHDHIHRCPNLADLCLDVQVLDRAGVIHSDIFNIIKAIPPTVKLHVVNLAYPAIHPIIYVKSSVALKRAFEKNPLPHLKYLGVRVDTPYEGQHDYDTQYRMGDELVSWRSVRISKDWDQFSDLLKSFGTDFYISADFTPIFRE